MAAAIGDMTLQQMDAMLQITHSMILLISHQLQIVKSVVSSVTVAMMDVFKVAEWTPKRLGHNQAVFIDTSPAIPHHSEGMISRNGDCHISMLVKLAPASPIPMVQPMTDRWLSGRPVFSPTLWHDSILPNEQR